MHGYKNNILFFKRGFHKKYDNGGEGNNQKFLIMTFPGKEGVIEKKGKLILTHKLFLSLN